MIPEPVSGVVETNAVDEKQDAVGTQPADDRRPTPMTRLLHEHACLFAECFGRGSCISFFDFLSVCDRDGPAGSIERLFAAVGCDRDIVGVEHSVAESQRSDIDRGAPLNQYGGRGEGSKGDMPELDPDSRCFFPADTHRDLKSAVSIGQVDRLLPSETNLDIPDRPSIGIDYLRSDLRRRRERFRSERGAHWNHREQ